MENLDLLNNDLQVSASVQSYLMETAKWGKFLAILGFIGCGLMLIFAFIFPAIMSAMPTSGSQASIISGSVKAIMTIVYLAFAILFFFPCLFLYRFSTNAQSSLKVINQEQFEVALMNLKSTFKFYGIISIIILSLYALIFIAGIVGAMFR